MGKSKFLKKNKRGFTLVELVVTMAIMAILVSIAVPAMNNMSKSRTKDKYKQYCASILESADAICDVYNKGASEAAGFKIRKDKKDDTLEIDRAGIRDCLNADNVYNYQYVVKVFSQNENGLTEGGGSVTSAYSKDTVVICFKKKSEKLYTAGCWYFLKNEKTAAYKFDYIKGEFIDNSTTFSTL